MANLPESPTFDAGVYQLELTDPVIGGASGVSNTPLKNLANRTKYLKDHVDALESSRAPLASPALTGTPTAPTAAQGTSTTQLATTAFVNAEIAADMAANLATAAPAMNGTAAVGVSTKNAREDHVHPTDTSRAPLASPALTGAPTAPTAALGTNNTQIATTAFVQQEIDADLVGLMPVGSVQFVAQGTAPTGWLKANGAQVSRTTYAALFAAIGTTFGAGNGSTTFNLPDLRGEFLRGLDDGRGVDGSRGLGTSQSHLVSSASQTVPVAFDALGSNGLGWLPAIKNTSAVYFNYQIGNGGSETRPRNIALLACIKY